MVENRSAWGRGVDPRERLKMEAQNGISLQRRDVGHACGKTGRGGRRVDTEIDAGSVSEGRRDCCFHEDDETIGCAFCEKTWRHSQQRAERSGPLGA